MFQSRLKVFLLGSFLALPLIAKAEESSEAPALHPRFGMSFGYTHSRWSEISNKLNNGSFAFGIDFSAQYFKNLETGLALNFAQGYSSTDSEENVHAFHFALEGRYFFSENTLRPYAGLGVAFGNYRVWTLASETPTTISYDKHASGALLGFVPQVGLRLAFTPRFDVDLRLSYVAYVNGTTASKMGGFAAAVGFGFSR
jgi:opacity protein-like surface antigen